MDGLSIGNHTLSRLQERAADEKISVDELINKLLDSQEQLRRSEANLRAVLSSAWHSFTLIDRNYRIMDVSEEGKRSALAVFGRMMKTGDSVYDFVLQRDLETFEKNFSSALRGETVVIERVFPTLEDGKELYFEMIYYPVINDAGLIDGVCLSYQNITKRKQIQQALTQSEARLRSLLEAQSAFVVRTSLDGKLTYVNSAFVKWYGTSSIDMSNISVLNIVMPEDRPQIMAVVEACIAQPCVPIQITLRKLADDNTVTWSLWEFVALVDEHDHPNEIQCIGMDVTNQVMGEQSRLEQERLLATLKKEQEFNALMQRVVSALAHDVRTPLAVIASAKNMLERYYDKLDEASRREKLENIGKHLRYVTEMLDDVTSTIRGNDQKSPFKPSFVNLEALCQVCVNEIHQTVGNKHILRFVSDQQIHSAWIDQTLVNRILLNLLSNAVKFSPEGSEVRLELSRRDDWIVMKVIDHGMGIDENDFPRLFEPFFRSDSAKPIHGTGLGLNIVKECAERHHGAISLESKVGVGTTFVVQLPLLSAPYVK